MSLQDRLDEIAEILEAEVAKGRDPHEVMLELGFQPVEVIMDDEGLCDCYKEEMISNICNHVWEVSDDGQRTACQKCGRIEPIFEGMD